MAGEQPEATARIAVCRDGPRGWHWIRLQDFDPARHVPYPPPTDAPQEPPKRPPGRPRKNTPTA